MIAVATAGAGHWPRGRTCAWVTPSPRLSRRRLRTGCTFSLCAIQTIGGRYRMAGYCPAALLLLADHVVAGTVAGTVGSGWSRCASVSVDGEHWRRRRHRRSGTCPALGPHHRKATSGFQARPSSSASTERKPSRVVDAAGAYGAGAKASAIWDKKGRISQARGSCWGSPLGGAGGIAMVPFGGLPELGQEAGIMPRGLSHSRMRVGRAEVFGRLCVRPITTRGNSAPTVGGCVRDRSASNPAGSTQCRRAEFVSKIDVCKLATADEAAGRWPPRVTDFDVPTPSGRASDVSTTHASNEVYC